MFDCYVTFKPSEKNWKPFDNYYKLTNFLDNSSNYFDEMNMIFDSFELIVVIQTFKVNGENTTSDINRTLFPHIERVWLILVNFFRISLDMYSTSVVHSLHSICCGTLFRHAAELSLSIHERMQVHGRFDQEFLLSITKDKRKTRRGTYDIDSLDVRPITL